MKLVVHPGGILKHELLIPGDKSISHRAIILASLAQGKSRVSNLLLGADNLATIDAFRKMGVSIDVSANDGTVVVDGVGTRGLQAPSSALDVGNSGTSMRLLAGILAAQSFDATLVGDESLLKRPMERIAAPLRQMGATIETSSDGTAPLHVRGGSTLKGITYKSPISSAQVKSAVLLASMYIEEEVTFQEPQPSRDHTERMLTAFGYPIESQNGVCQATGMAELTAVDLVVPGDISSAAFFLVGASIAEGSEVVLPAVGINPTRTGVLDILAKMGANIACQNQRLLGNEPVADITVTSSQLRGIEIPQTLVPLAIDEFPAIFVAAALAEGTTILRGAKELRVKESDRISVMAEGLNALGIHVTEYEDGIAIEGGAITGGVIDAKGDHRVAMAFAMAALRAGSAITILNAENIMTSFPNFLELAKLAGLSIDELREE